jgi:murein DD-endopeptidase MepM/ murein hydrolase activator NlpD
VAVIGVAAIAVLGASGQLPFGPPAKPPSELGGAVLGARETVPAESPPDPAATSSPTPSADPAAADSSEAPGSAPTGDSASLSSSGYRWPLHDARLTNPFGPSEAGTLVVDGQLFHDGIDISTVCGDRVVAAHDGVVLAASRHFDAFVGWRGDLTAYFARLDEKDLWPSLAKTVVIDDGDGYRAIYAHFEKIVVKVGQTVRAGDLLGYEGRTGLATGCHVHFGLFDPTSPDSFELEPSIVAKTHLPSLEVARIDPLTVLPPMEAAGITWGWGAEPSASP